MRLTTKEVETRMARLRQSKDVREAMAIRCEDEGHQYDGCCTPTFQVYQECHWCGDQK